MEKKRIGVVIDGRSYVVISEDEDAYVREVAEEVSAHLLAASRTAINLDTRDCAILTAMDFCDESKKERRHSKELVAKADQIMQRTNDLNKKCADYRDRLTDAMNEITRLSKRVRALEDQLRTLNRENERLKKFEPKKADAEKLFEQTVQEKRAEKMMGYMAMQQGSLFDDEPEPPPASKGKKKKKNGKH